MKPDFEVGVQASACDPAPGQPKGWTPTNPPDLDYIHRRDGNADIYFVANRTNRAERVTRTFRVAGKAPELWDAVSGERRFAAAYIEADDRTSLPLEFAPCGSRFVVFHEPAASRPATAKSNAAEFKLVHELPAPWTAHFVPGMSAPERDSREMLRSDTRPIVFDKLTSWTGHSNPGIKFYSGIATYTKTFDAPGEDGSISSDAIRGHLSNRPDKPAVAESWTRAAVRPNSWQAAVEYPTPPPL